jgi:hypothetical protein
MRQYPLNKIGDAVMDASEVAAGAAPARPVNAA